MIRVGNHKLIVYPEANVVRLYDLESDPLEMDDLAQNPEFKPLIRRLFKRLLNVQKEMDDPLDLCQKFPDLAAR